MKRATIADIAARAGVSKSTVSHTLSGKRPISLATQSRVRAVIDEVGYRPSALAQRLAGGGHARNIGLVFPLSAPLIASTETEFIVNAANAANAADYTFLLLTHLEGNTTQFERMVAFPRHSMKPPRSMGPAPCDAFFRLRCPCLPQPSSLMSY